MTPHVHFRREGEPSESLVSELACACQLYERIGLELAARCLEATRVPVDWRSVEGAERFTAGLRDVAVLLGIERGERA